MSDGGGDTSVTLGDAGSGGGGKGGGDVMSMLQNLLGGGADSAGTGGPPASFNPDDPSTFPTPPLPPDVVPPAGTGGGVTPGKPVTQQLADALGKLGTATSGAHNPAPVQAALRLSPPQVQSQAVRGQSSLSNLVQMLMQRAQQYGPPAAGGGSGLLGR